MESFPCATGRFPDTVTPFHRTTAPVPRGVPSSRGLTESLDRAGKPSCSPAPGHRWQPALSDAVANFADCMSSRSHSAKYTALADARTSVNNGNTVAGQKRDFRAAASRSLATNPKVFQT